MKMKFEGRYEALQDKVLLTGIYGKWRDLGNQKQYRAQTGAILNWWESTGSIVFQGDAAAVTEFEQVFLAQSLNAESVVGGGVRSVPSPQRA